MGARTNALGYASTCIRDEWSVFNNTGGLSSVDQTSAGFTSIMHPRFKAFNSMAAVFAVPLKKWGVAGLGVFRFGDDLYNEQLISTAFSSKFGLASLGIKVNYIQYTAKGLNTKRAASVSMGGIAELTPHLFAGAHITNINQPELSSDGERLPVILSAGLGFTLSEKVFATTEVEKDLDYEPVWKTGLEYGIYKKIVIRTGFNINPAAGFFGVGFHPRKFRMDYAYTYRPDVGTTHQATVSCKLKPSRK